jgi:multimeric flavodoxin WrbA
MKILALNSSARVGNGSVTEIMLNHLVQGMESAGAEVEVINLHQKKIRYCSGCFTCWTKTPGSCIHRDDMSKEIFPQFLKCDLCILATPLYHFTVNAQMKTFIERTLPMVQPFFVQRDGVTHHPLRNKPPWTAILSVAGFPEESVFNQLKSYVRFMYQDRLVTEIYRSSAGAFGRSEKDNTIKQILEDTIQAGRELVESGSISQETLARIKKPVTTFEKFAPLGNLIWQTCIDQGVSREEFEKRKIIPRPNSIETFLAVMNRYFNPGKAGKSKMKIQYNFSGKVAGYCHLSVENGKFDADQGRLENPDLTIDAPFDVWMDILTAKSDGLQMLNENKYTINGRKDLLPSLGQFFSS